MGAAGWWRWASALVLACVVACSEGEEADLAGELVLAEAGWTVGELLPLHSEGSAVLRDSTLFTASFNGIRVYRLRRE